MTSNKKDKQEDHNEKTLQAKVVADQAGSDADTGEALYQVELSLKPEGSLVSGTLVMEYKRDEYKALKEDQLAGEDDYVTVTL